MPIYDILEATLQTLLRKWDGTFLDRLDFGHWLEDRVLTASIRVSLREQTKSLRSTRKLKSGNVAAAVLHLRTGELIPSIATSKPVPIPDPTTKSQGPDPITGLGGHYEPLKHLGYSRHYDSEFKILSDITDQLLQRPGNPAGSLHLFTEREACPSCYYVLSQFMKRFPGISARFYSIDPERWLGLRVPKVGSR